VTGAEPLTRALTGAVLRGKEPTVLDRLIAHITDWLDGMRAISREFDRIAAEAKADTARPAVQAQITYYGKHGEMGHPADRAYPDDGEW